MTLEGAIKNDVFNSKKPLKQRSILTTEYPKFLIILPS